MGKAAAFLGPIVAIAANLVCVPVVAVPQSPAPDARFLIPERVIAASQARQGVASDGRAIYVIDNSEIGKYAISDGKLLKTFHGDAKKFPHLNSCTIAIGQLVCASSNYPSVPHTGTVEIFDPHRLTHVRSVLLLQNPGSLTALDRHDDRWWAIFANYDGKGGAIGKDHRDTVFAELDDSFSIARHWQLPQSVLKRIAPRSISGVSWGAGGCIYASGHDKPEIYVLKLAEDGKELRHVATLSTASFGQAIDVDPVHPDLIWTIDRKSRQVFASKLPDCGETQ